MGFTLIGNYSYYLGCIQTDEQGYNTSMGAVRDCFNAHGARIPTYSEILIAFENYELNDETDDSEWVDSVYRADGENQYGLIAGSQTPQFPSGNLYTFSYAYRCFLPISGR